MILRIFLQILFITLIQQGYCQIRSQLEGTIHRAPFKFVYLKTFYGIKTTILDSSIISKDDSFSFRNVYPTGYYRLELNDTNYIDLILKPEEAVKINSINGNLKELQFTESTENLLVQEVKQEKKKINKLINQINIQLSYVTHDSVLYKVLNNQKDSINKKFNNYLKEKIQANPGTFFAKTTAALIIPTSYERQDFQKKYHGKDREFLKDHFFDNIDFSDGNLVRTTLLPNRYMLYFENYVEYNETGFKKAVDLILSKANSNSEVYELSLDFLMELFNKVGPEIIVEYLVENHYMKNSCANPSDSVFIQKKNAYKAVSINSISPDIFISDINGKHQRLTEITKASKITILFFWSSHCGFCEQLLPEIKKLYIDYNQKGLEVFSISLDTEKDDWIRSTSNYSLNWINTSELKGWDSKAVKTYMVNRTPYFFIIDNVHRIIAKGNKLEEMKRQVETLLK